jgi:MFS-type transporter involved in bile tolerance (Atg22 family)
MKNQNLLRIVAGTALILLIPLIGMLVSDDFNWGPFDFAVIGGLLLGAGFLFEFISSRLNKKYHPAAAIVVLGIVALIWIELAVGIFESPFAGS